MGNLSPPRQVTGFPAGQDEPHSILTSILSVIRHEANFACCNKRALARAGGISFFFFFFNSTSTFGRLVMSLQDLDLSFSNYFHGPNEFKERKLPFFSFSPSSITSHGSRRWRIAARQRPRFHGTKSRRPKAISISPRRCHSPCVSSFSLPSLLLSCADWGQRHKGHHRPPGMAIFYFPSWAIVFTCFIRLLPPRNTRSLRGRSWPVLRPQTRSNAFPLHSAALIDTNPSQIDSIPSANTRVISLSEQKSADYGEGMVRRVLIPF